MAMASDDLRGSAPVMSARDLLLELYHDMKVVRPIAEELKRANLIDRVQALETDHAIRDAQGGMPLALVARVAALEDVNQDELAEKRGVGKVLNWSNKTLAIVVLITNFVLGVWVTLANGLHF
jgi:hypothetical protein